MVSNFDCEIWIVELSSAARNRQCIFRNGLGPKTEICSVISVAAEANWPAMADDINLSYSFQTGPAATPAPAVNPADHELIAFTNCEQLQQLGQQLQRAPQLGSQDWEAYLQRGVEEVSGDLAP